MAGKKPQNNLFETLYSQTFENVARTAAMNAADSNCSSFRTDPYRTDGGWISWCVAWKYEPTGCWNIVQHQRLPSSGETGSDLVSHSQRTVKSDLCFFDALYLCGAFESERENAGCEKLTPDQNSHCTLAYYATAAENAAVPLDRSGLPLPAAFGVILVDGDFSDHAYEVAARTAGQDLPVAASAQTALVPAIGMTTLSAEIAKEKTDKRIHDRLKAQDDLNAALAPFEQRRTEVNDLLQTLKSAAALNRIVQTSVAKSFGKVGTVVKSEVVAGSLFSGFGTGFSLIAVAASAAPLLFFTVPIGVGMAGYAGYHAFIRPGAHGELKRTQKAMDQTISYYLDGSEHAKLFEDFTRAARGIFALEEAALAYARKGPGNKKGLGKLEEAIKEMDLNRESAENLRQSYKKAGFPPPGTFAAQLDALYACLEDEVNKRALAILQPQNGAPALPPPA